MKKMIVSLLASVRTGTLLTSAEIRVGIEQAEAEHAAAVAALKMAEITYRDSLMDEDLEVAHLAAARRMEAEIAVDRAVKIGELLRAKLEPAIAADAEAARLDRYRTAAKAGEAARVRLFKEYEGAARTIAGIVTEIAAADAAISSANRDLPNGVAPIPSIDAARDLGPHGREEIHRRTVDAWVFAETGHKIAGRDDQVTSADGRHGVIYSSDVARNHPIRVVRKRFHEIEFHPADTPIMPSLPFVDEVRLPGLRGAEPSFVPVPVEADRSPRKRGVRIEYLPAD